jgi:hypothetical protein
MELAARRGERGLSALVEEALVQYLDEEQRRRRGVEEAQAVIGAMDGEAAIALEESVRTLRKRWR